MKSLWCAIFALAVGYASVTAVASAAPAPTTSRYMSTTNYNTLYNEGCSMGTAGLGGAVILDFGEPWYSGGYGTIIYGSNSFASIAQITTAAEGYLDGFWNCSPSTPVLRLAVGTSNYGSQVSAGHGTAWGQLINTLNSYISSKGYGSQEYARGANDMELDWNSFSTTRAWEDAYNAATTAPLYDYGDAAGCPPYGSCNNGWNQYDLWYVSWGVKDAWPFPEIYATSGANASEWYQESLYSVNNQTNGKLDFLGALTQYAACNCGGNTNSPAQGFDQLQNDINGNSATAYGMSYSSDITWAN